MKILKWISNNILFVITLFLLAFIPLYPKRPLLDVVNTWVYIRAEDFVVFSTLLVWIWLLIKKKINLKTPLTMSIILFWVIGALSTIHGILLIFPELPNVFPNLAFMSFLRRIEYLSLFFVAYAAMKDKKKVLPYVITVLTLTVVGVSLYGIGQRYLGFPAFLTMNEEFAKGAPIQLSALSRIPSTFGGHYDLAAYLVLVIPILASLLFGLRNWFVRIALVATIGLGFIVLFWTVSRVSFFVLLLSLAGVLFFYKRKLVLISLPIVVLIVAFVFVNFSSRLLDRYGNTVKEIDVLVNAETGEALGNIKEVTPADFQDKIVWLRQFKQRGDIDAGVTKPDAVPGTIPSTVQNPATQDPTLQSSDTQQSEGKTPSATNSAQDLRYLMNLSEANAYIATISGVVPYSVLPRKSVQLVQPNASTGENLPQGTGYANLALSPVKMRLSEFFYQRKGENENDTSADVVMFQGDFLVKKASAYDLSLTTRYQGEWPHAIEAFNRNVLFGSGYSSISLAIDNNYLRILGEVGALGMVSFLLIFLTAGMYMVKVFPHVESRMMRSFTVGFFAGVVGLALNATLIDVFEASKVAFYLWLLMGITLGLLHAYQIKQFSFYDELKKAAGSTVAIISYLTIATVMLFSPMVNNFFVGDDFTWLRWAATSNGLSSIPQYFMQADGFFYRPGTKVFFQFMYDAFWLNPLAYHVASLVLHIIVVALVFMLGKKILKNVKLAALAAFLFVFVSGYSETIFWISSIGHIVASLFVLLSLLLFIIWQEKKHLWYLIASLLSVFVSLLFHELGVVAPLLMLLYVWYEGSFFRKLKAHKLLYSLLFTPVVFYLIVRYFANTHWSGGDYSYNLVKLPFNMIGNLLGYVMLSSLGPLSLPLYEKLRDYSREHLAIAFVAAILLAGLVVLLYRVFRKLEKADKKLIIFAVGFMVLSLLPFLGLGNITSRYDYLVSFGFVLLGALFIRNAYEYLLSSGRDVAMGIMAVLLGVIVLFNIIQVQKLHGDWKGAGEKVNTLFISIQGLYSNDWAAGPVDLYFVNVPIRNGDAWVFPVGLSDALWFTFESTNIRVHQMGSVEDALKLVTDPKHQKVFVFDQDGKVTEKRKKLPQVME